MPPSRPPRHATPVPSRRRAVLVPAVLLLSVGAALGGLAVLPSGLAPRTALTAAADTAPMLLADQPDTVPHHRDLSLIDQPQTAVPARAPVRASRTRTLTPMASAAFVRPDGGPLTSGFKWRWGRMHTGIDLAGPYGCPVVAVTAGTVIEADWESGYGNIVKISHDGGVVTYYAHLSNILVHSGPVVAGEQIADEGDTGHSTGPHLHFEVRIDGVPIDPIPWLASHGIIV